MDIQALQGIASIVGGLVFTFLISREESKPKHKRNKKYSKYGRPVLNEILKTKGINLSDSYVKEIHKTMMSVGKKKGVKEFHKKVTPEIEKILTKGLNDLKSKKSDGYKKTLAKSLVNEFASVANLEKLKSESKSKKSSRRLNDYRRRSVANQSRPVANQSRPVANQSRPVANQSRPVANQSRPVANQSRPVANQSRRSVESQRISQSQSSEYVRKTTKPFSLVKPKGILKNANSKSVSVPRKSVSVPRKSVSVPRKSVSVHGGLNKRSKKRSHRRISRRR